MSTPLRPLSPHLQIYKLPLTALVSITHRITGVILSIGLLFVSCSLIVIVSGNETYQAMQTGLNQPLGQIGLVFFIYALFFHFCHGIRHLIWDLGFSYHKATLNFFIAIELGASVMLTATALLFF